MTQVRILVAEDQHLVRDGIVTMLGVRDRVQAVIAAYESGLVES